MCICINYICYMHMLCTLYIYIYVCLSFMYVNVVWGGYGRVWEGMVIQLYTGMTSRPGHLPEPCARLALACGLTAGRAKLTGSEIHEDVFQIRWPHEPRKTWNPDIHNTNIFFYIIMGSNRGERMRNTTQYGGPSSGLLYMTLRPGGQ